MNEIMSWLGDVFYMDVSSTKTYSGYYTERVSQGNYSYSTFELPFDVTVTEVSRTLNGQAVCAFVLIVLVFVTVVTWLKGALR